MLTIVPAVRTYVCRQRPDFPLDVITIGSFAAAREHRSIIGLAIIARGTMTAISFTVGSPHDAIKLTNPNEGCITIVA
mgnify:CR=1 FL=1|eukprot:scaffold220618_cov36-Tisochrysis_lutea.AAC.2